MKRTLLLTGMMLMPLIVHAQQVLDCSTGNCKYVNPSSASKSAAQSSATARANSTSRSTAQSGVVQGSTVNAPVTTRSAATGGAGGSSTVTVVNRVSSGYGGGGGFRRGAGGSGGGSAAGDPPAPTDPAATDPGPALGSQRNPLTENIGGNTTQTLRNTPEIVAPNISGGNPCLVGVSGGGAGPGIGITLGFGYSDRGCDRRNNAALLSNIGLRDAAMELMCQDDSVRRALSQSGHPCAEDRPTAAAAPAPVAAVDPAVIRREQEAVAPVPPPITIVPTAVAVAGAVKPAWCSTTAPSEMKDHPECR